MCGHPILFLHKPKSNYKLIKQLQALQSQLIFAVVVSAVCACKNSRTVKPDVLNMQRCGAMFQFSTQLATFNSILLCRLRRSFIILKH